MARISRFGPFLLDPIFELGSNASGGDDTNCTDGVQWLYHLLGECDDTVRKQASAYLGLVSVLLWMMVGIPQIIKNFRNIDGMAGISFFLLFNWSTGDTTNLVGCFLTGQLMSQVVLGVYFVASDLVLLSQYAYFVIRRRRQRTQEASSVNSGASGPKLILCLMGLFTMSNSMFALLGFSSSWGGSQDGRPSRHLSRSLLSTDSALLFEPEVLPYSAPSEDLTPHLSSLGNKSVHTGPQTTFWHNTTNIIGYAIGIVSSLFYLGSRISQIIKNIKNQSTEGLSIFTFILAVFGNLAYGLQILVRSLEVEFILEHTPWLVGSLGVIGLDLTLLCQFKYYSKKHRNMDEVRQALLTHDYPINAEEQQPIVESAGAPPNYSGEII